MDLDKKGVSVMGLIVAFLLGIAVLLISFLIFPNFSLGVSILDAFAQTGYSGTEVIANSCELSCLDRSVEEFCIEEKKWDVGDGRSLKGTCLTLSEMDLAGTPGISPCGFVECGTSEPVVCYREKKKVDCSEL